MITKSSMLITHNQNAYGSYKKKMLIITILQLERGLDPKKH